MISKNIIYHIAFWLIHTLFVATIIYLRAPNFDKLDYAISEALLVSTFYANVFGILLLTQEKKIFQGILAILICLVAYCALKYVHRFIFLPSIGHMDFFIPFEWKGFLNDTLYNFVEYFFYAVGFSYAKRFFLSEKAALQLQNKKIEIENNYLKAQINPHFLYNTLDFIYNKTEASNKQAAKCIYLLTEIMSYSLDNDSDDGMVDLEEEITHLDNYIELQQLRFENTLYIKFDKKGKFSDIRIPHYTLITFIENVFKHGIVNDPVYPLAISITCFSGKLIFEVNNRKDNATKITKTSSGVGLKNVQERLRLVYGNKQSVTITETESDFALTMKILLFNGLI